MAKAVNGTYGGMLDVQDNGQMQTVVSQSRHLASELDLSADYAGKRISWTLTVEDAPAGTVSHVDQAATLTAQSSTPPAVHAADGTS